MNNNELIAEFAGLNKLYDADGNVLWDIMNTNNSIYTLRTHELRYDKSWDCLMSVVDKIESMGYEVNIQPGFTEISGGECNVSTYAEDGDTKIFLAYLCVVEFIKWYNDASRK